MDHIENSIYRDSRFIYRATQKFSDPLLPMREKYLKHILKFLYCNKYNKINIYHSDKQRNVSYKK